MPAETYSAYFLQKFACSISAMGYSGDSKFALKPTAEIFNKSCVGNNGNSK
jgi:hypothetical protein